MDEKKDTSEAQEMAAATRPTPEDELDDEVEVWVVDDDGEAVEDEAVLAEAEAETATGAEVPVSRAALQRELQDARNQWMRTLADFDNFRKRAEREKSDLKRYALVEPMRDLLPVIDNLQRALEADGSVDDLKAGVQMTLKQMLELLERRGLKPVAAVGHPFDPAVHDAVSRFEDPDVSEPTVSDELQSGYLIHDRLLRPAMVRVAMPEETDKPED